jgi:hypothetical protein
VYGIDATAFALIFTAVLQIIRFSFLAGPNATEYEYDNGVSKWWRFVGRLPLVTIIACYSSVAIFLFSVIDNDPKNRNRVCHSVIIVFIFIISYSDILFITLLIIDTSSLVSYPPTADNNK